MKLKHCSSDNQMKKIFGPVPSRRLGYSLGINHVPPKHCSYACVYCQVGRTTALEITPREFYPVEEIVNEVEEKIRECEALGQEIDYLTFVPDGEPTLDLHLAEEIIALRQFGFPIAVISNASLLKLESAREALCLADWVSLKVDSVVEETWRKINRPHHHLKLDQVMQAMYQFAHQFSGELVTETMLIKDLNDSETEMTSVATFLNELQPLKVYLAIPIRPPAELWVAPPDPEKINLAYQILHRRVVLVELLATPEDNLFHVTSDLARDVLAITAVHPLREEVVLEMARKSGQSWEVIEELIAQGLLVCLQYEGSRFYLRRFK